MQNAAAETLALKGLAFLAGDGEVLTRFLSLSGLDPQDLRARADDPLLLAAVLDFILQDDQLTLGFAEAEGIEPKLIHDARRALSAA
jgi:Protein of unknown function (DUF3572)